MGITLKQLAERFQSAADTAAGMETMATEITAAAVDDVQKRMDQGLQPDGVTTQTPLKRSRRSGNTGPPLIDYGDLRKSVQAEIRGTRVVLSATGPGARRHQAERPFLGVSPETQAAIVGMVLAGLLKNIEGS